MPMNIIINSLFLEGVDGGWVGGRERRRFKNIYASFMCRENCGYILLVIHWTAKCFNDLTKQKKSMCLCLCVRGWVGGWVGACACVSACACVPVYMRVKG